MAISVTNEAHVFLLSLIGGVLVGIFFDMFRTMRRLVKSGAVFVGVQDMLFWLFFAGAAFFFLYRFNYGQPRWYIFCGILLGALFYHLLFGDTIIRLFLILIRLFCALLRFLLRAFLFPLCILWRIFRPFFRFGERFFNKIFYGIKKKISNIRMHFLIVAKKIKKRRKMY